MKGYISFAWLCMVSADVVSESVMEGESVTLHTDVNKLQHDTMLWYYINTLIALINGNASTSCLYDGEDGIFRDRLKVDYESGSLTISDIRSEHTGRYEAELIRSESSGKKQSLNRNPKCDPTKITRKTTNSTTDTIKTFNVNVRAATEHKDPKTTNDESDKEKIEQEHGKRSGLSEGDIAGIVVAVAVVVLLVFAVVGVIYCRHRKKGIRSVFRSCHRNSSDAGLTDCHTGDLEKGKYHLQTL